MAERMNLVCPFAAGWTLIKLWNNWEGWETYWAVLMLWLHTDTLGAKLDGSCRRTVKVDRRKNTLTIGCRVELNNVAG